MTHSLSMLFPRYFVVMMAIVLSACSVPETETDIHDPYEPTNRKVHAFNKGLDRTVLRPVSQAYGEVLPAPVRTGVDNVASNLGLPAAVLNKSLQGNGEDAFHNLFRFLINSSMGIGGLFDPATAFGLEERGTDFGATLAVWGVPEGAYREVPLFGPSTERDAAGQLVDAVLNPLTVFNDNVLFAGNAGTVTERLNARYNFADTFDGIIYESADSYVQLRLFYLDNRRFTLASDDDDAFDTTLYDDLYDDVYDE